MNKKTIALFVLGGLIIFSSAIAVVTLFSAQFFKDDATTAQPASASKTEMDPISTTTDSSIAHTPGMYMTYDQSAFNAHAEQRRVLFFHAPWCPQCVALDKDIAATNLPADVALFKVDYDSNQELRKKHGVTLQTTFVLVDADGNQVKKYTAYATPNYASVKTNLLD